MQLLPRASARTVPGLGRRSRRTHWASAWLVATALAASGCTGTPSAPPTSPAATPAPTATASTPMPTPSRSAPPERPAAMDRDDIEGAIAAAQYFLELYPYAYNTGDLTAWKAMSHPECIFCASVVENVEELHAAGGYEVGGDIVIESLTASEPVAGNEYFAVDFSLGQEPGERYSSDGSQVETFGNESSDAYFAISHDGLAWTVREVTITAST